MRIVPFAYDTLNSCFGDFKVCGKKARHRNIPIPGDQFACYPTGFTG